MVTIVFANLIAYQWYGRSLYDYQLRERGIDLSMGRERAYLMHHSVAEHVTDELPVVHRDISLSELRERIAAKSTESAVNVDNDNRYLGMVLQHQLHDQHDSADQNCNDYNRINHCRFNFCSQIGAFFSFSSEVLESLIELPGSFT